MSTSKKTALVASAVAMTLTASLAAAAPANAAPPPPPGEGLTPQVARVSQQAIPKRVGLKKKDIRHLGALQAHDDGVYAGGSAPIGGLYCDTTENGATGDEQAPLLNRWWMWYDPANDTDVSVDHIVTTWYDAAGAMVDLQNDTGICRATLLGNYVVQYAGDGGMVATWDDAAAAARVVDNAIVSVTVTDWNDRIDERAEAERLLEIAVANAAKVKRLG